MACLAPHAPMLAQPCTRFHVTISALARNEPAPVQRHMLVRRLVLNGHVYAFGSNVNHVATTTAEAGRTSTDYSQIDANDAMFREDKDIIHIFKKYTIYCDKMREALLP